MPARACEEFDRLLVDGKLHFVIGHRQLISMTSSFPVEGGEEFWLASRSCSLLTDLIVVFIQVAEPAE